MLNHLVKRKSGATYKDFFLCCVYFAGLSCTCIGVAIILRSGLGVDAWNTVIAKLASFTPITLGTWAILLQGSFWIITSCLNRKIEINCIIPIIWKGISLDIAKAAISMITLSNGAGLRFLWFLIGYIILGVSTGTYIATGFPRMPIDGLMLAIKDFFSWDIKKSRLLIEALGFLTMFIVGGKIQIGTIIITFTASYIFSFSHDFAAKKFKAYGIRKQGIIAMEHFVLRPADTKETETAMALIDEAKAHLKAQGIEQWQSGYPDMKMIKEDISRGRGYFLTDGFKTAAYLCIDFEGEPAYDHLQGNWNSNLHYAVIHRMAISKAYRGKGIASIAFRLAEKLCIQKGVYSIRVDTDEDNAIMKHILAKNGFTYCGTIWFDNSVKHAYEKLLQTDDSVHEKEV